MEALALSALQHLLYCERQCALIHVEQTWAENRFTALGREMHRYAHGGPDESRPGVRITRGLRISCERLGLAGQCDVVEFHSCGRVLPIEYKRGKPKSHRADEVQLCAQGLCLESMLGISILEGRLYYGQTRRRLDVPFDGALRALTLQTVRRLRELLESGTTPVAKYQPERCDHCSLIELCMPKAGRFHKSTQAWFTRSLAAPE
jgi:CRISPR-associated exonuclease Cas4